MKRCCVLGCEGAKIGHTLFKIPSLHDEHFVQWRSMLEQHGDPLLWQRKQNYICSTHFRREDFRRTPMRVLLKPGALPSIFEIQNVSLSPRPESEPTTQILDNDENLPENQVNVENPDLPCHTPIPDPDSASVKVISLKEYNDLKYTERVLNNKIRSLRNLVQKTKVQLLETETKLCEAQLDSQLVKKLKQDVEENVPQAVFIMDQIKNYGKKMNNWSETSIRFCTMWRFCSPKGYEYPRKQFLNLPSRSTLNRYVESRTGDQTLIVDRLKAEAQVLSPVEKLCSLVTDDMSINEKCSYSHSEDKMYGYESNGPIGDQEMANKLLCFVIHGLTTKYTIPVGYFFHKHLKSEIFFELTQKVLKTVTECGFVVLRLVADNHQSNVSLFKHFGNGQLQISIVHPLIPHIPLFFSFDSSHAIKNGRNQYLENRLSSPEGQISSEYLKLLYNMQKKWLVKPVKFLTKKHLYPSNLEKMNVLRAVQIFSPAVTAALKYLQEFAAHEYPCFANVSATVEFMEIMYNFFELHDVSNRTQYIHTRAPNTAPYTNVNDERLNWLHTTFPNYINSINGLTKETSEAMKFTAESTYQCVRYLLSEKGFYYVLTRSFNSDCIEATFSHIRLRGGSHDVTDARSAEYAIKQILKCGIMKSSSAANVGSVSYCSTAAVMPLQQNDTNFVQITSSNDLPEEIKSMLDNFPNNCLYGDENIIYCSSVAFVAGYLIKKIEDNFECNICTSNISNKLPDIDNSSLLGLLYLQDRGKLKYPTETFVRIIYHVVNIIKKLLPYLLTDHIALQIIKLLQHPLEESGYFTCTIHKKPVITLILDKLSTILLSNLCLNQNDSVRRITLRSKPKSRKILKISAS